EHFCQHRFLPFFDSRLDPLKNCRAAGKRFEAPSVSTTALRPINVDDHVADLTGRMVEPAVELTVDDYSSAYSRAYKDSNDITGLGFQFSHMHAQNRNIPIVFN